jgi:hypothetical protein
MLGHIDAYFYAYVAGIRSARPGAYSSDFDNVDEPHYCQWRSIIIAPQPPPGLTWAHASFRSPIGEVSSSWQAEWDADGTRLLSFSLETLVPSGAIATIGLPISGRTLTVRGGSHSFRE